ncbi:hypothetical protein LMG28688_02062 [Paraburkholderia caffeinitolerans]|uniref:DUF6566 domain-containing protein n=1 Tax=Paraburkholderia caffeinitolerans TaxID=1723730 RepID=A0A6J5FWS0_9BURK|nr:DUF6566 family protein [Paraburkholderia caffeinitolerans]CAB3785550.1 hypothetical protein LMG28688_02062 [Paraburkholderia caffeinitolerans]
MARTESMTCHGFEITTQSRDNGRGGWIAHVEVRHDGRLFATCSPDTVQPEWLTEEEANRDGLERGCKFITHIKTGGEDRSWVAIREHAERWFFRIESSQEAEQIVRDLHDR